MKIGFMGNTNNYPFLLARALLSLGHDVLVIVHRPEKLHRPEYRYADINHPYPDWILDLPLEDDQFVKFCQNRTIAIEQLQKCDFVVLNDLAISLAKEIGRPYVAMLTGSDLTFYAAPESRRRALSGITSKNPLKWIWGRLIWNRKRNRQLEGIAQANLVSHFARGILPASDEQLDRLGITDDGRIFLLMSEVETLFQTPPPTKKERLRTFCATRLSWAGAVLPGENPLDRKGSDVMIRGISIYRQRGNPPLDVHLVKKGEHVAETVELIESEQLADWVTWHEEMTQLEVWQQYDQSDVVFEQFGDGFVAMAGLEAMASGRAVIASGRPEIFEPLTGEVSPVCQARTPEEIATHLEQLAHSHDKCVSIGQASREYIRRHFTPNAAAQTVLEKMAPHVNSSSG